MLLENLQVMSSCPASAEGYEIRSTLWAALFWIEFQQRCSCPVTHTVQVLLEFVTILLCQNTPEDLGVVWKKVHVASMCCVGKAVDLEDKQKRH